jgi:Polysaccharide lyase
MNCRAMAAVGISLTLFVFALFARAHRRPSCLAFVTTAVLLFSSIGTARATVSFREDFESGTLGRFTGKNNPPGRVVVVMKGAEVVDRGNYAVKVTMMGDEMFNAEQLRVQLASINVNVAMGGDTFMSFYLYVKEAPKTRDNFYYYEGGGGNVMTWWLEPKVGGGTVMKYGTGNLGLRGLLWTGDFEVGQWHQLAAHVHWGNTDQTGNITLWFDGNLVLDKMVQTMLNPAQYFSQPGIHRDAKLTMTSAVGIDSLYFDNFITADKLEDIELMMPAPGTPDAGAGGEGASTPATGGAGGFAMGGSSGSGGGSAGSGGASAGGASAGGSGPPAGAAGAGGAAATVSGGRSGGTSGPGGSPVGGGSTGGGCSVMPAGRWALRPLALLALVGLAGLHRRRRRG